MFRQKNKYLFFLSVFLLLGITSCGRQPKGILTEEQLEEVLVKIHIADGVFMTEGFRHTPEAEKARYYQSILDNFGITQAQYDSSLIWYTSHPEQFEKVYQRVIDDLIQYEKDVQEKGKMLAEAGLPDTPVAIAQNYFIRYGYSKDSLPLNFILKNIVLMPADNYVFRFNYQLNADTCSDYQATMKVFYNDGWIDLFEQGLVNDGKKHSFCLTGKATRSMGIDSVCTAILLPDSCGVATIDVDSISVFRNFTVTDREKEYQDFMYHETLRKLHDYFYNPSGYFNIWH